MKIFYTDEHLLHHPKAELHRGQMIDPHEGPHRMDILLAGMQRAGFKDFLSAPDLNESVLLGVHTADYIDFVKTAWQRWDAAGYAGDVLPMSYPHRERRSTPPKDIDGAAGYFASSSDTVITKTSWDAVKAVAACSVAAAKAISGGTQSSFALIRPPGHHAGADYMSGYCILNNCAIAAQTLRRDGAKRVAILDVDFHHGNGTQDIFYERDDVLFTSIHGDPDHHFPYFWGHKDETGTKAGQGFTVNYPLPAGTTYDPWSLALEDALKHISRFKADVLVVSLGVDTFEDDPISTFKLKDTHYPLYGAIIAKLGRPTVFIMEGGYGVPKVGDNVAGVLTGFLNL